MFNFDASAGSIKINEIVANINYIVQGAVLNLNGNKFCALSFSNGVGSCLNSIDLLYANSTTKNIFGYDGRNGYGLNPCAISLVSENILFTPCSNTGEKHRSQTINLAQVRFNKIDIEDSFVRNEKGQKSLDFPYSNIWMCGSTPDGLISTTAGSDFKVAIFENNDWDTISEI